MCDSGVIVWGEIWCWSLLGFKGLTRFPIRFTIDLQGPSVADALTFFQNICRLYQTFGCTFFFFVLLFFCISYVVDFVLKIDQIQRKIALVLKMTFCQLESCSLPSMMKPEWLCDFLISDYSEEKSWKMLNDRWKFSIENKKAHAQLQIGGISWLCRRSKRLKTQL